MTLGTGLLSYLLVNDIYIANEETLVLASFVAFMRFAFLKASKPLADFLDNSANVLHLLMLYRKLLMSLLKQEMTVLLDFKRKSKS